MKVAIIVLTKQKQKTIVNFALINIFLCSGYINDSCIVLFLYSSIIKRDKMTELKIMNVILITVFIKTICCVKSENSPSTSSFAPNAMRFTTAKIAIIQIATLLK
ncbi:hypothetical protein bcere0026_42870 [Bacillus mycoides]|uniref:Uncharacterized protein n=1 Tax=Bacillus mycoides TaxID=1405 RepID=C2Y002_BACMY|nr:hypothetical protein bcere0026_42870 [Bacillus mycoides]